MGNSSKKIKNKQVLICGLDSAGKTTLFKLLVYGFQKEKAENPYQELNKLNDEPTFGFNFEYAEKDQAQSIGFWDLGGKDSIRAIWPSFYKNIAIGGIIFVVDSNDSDDRINEARMELLKLLNEEELRSAVVYVVFNDVIKNTDNDEKESPILRDYKKQSLVILLIRFCLIVKGFRRKNWV